MSKGGKIIVGILTLVPFIAFPFFAVHLVIFILHMASHHHDPEPADIVAGAATFILPLLLMVFVTIGLLIFYIIHALNNKTIDSTEKIIWILIFIFVGVIGFPIYWIMRIWGNT